MEVYGYGLQKGNPMISVLILTLDEEYVLEECLRSVSWSDDVHVFDSGSRDATPEIASKHGASFSNRDFDGYASQRNAALSKCPFKHEWILILDADERIPAGGHDRLMSLIRQAPSDVAAFRLRRRDYMEGRWLKHAQISPWYIRLLRKGRGTYHREVNEVLEVDGRVAETDFHFDHHPFAKGVGHWMQRHIRYARMEADRLLEERRTSPRFSLSKAILSRDFNERRFHQKGLYYRLPFRPLLKWIYMMFWRMSFLDGRQGVTYAWLQTFYEYLIVLNVRESSGSRRDDPRE
jgi:glycosyltransferase involved in cell wall biosynthesis